MILVDSFSSFLSTCFLINNNYGFMIVAQEKCTLIMKQVFYNMDIIA